MPSSTSPLTTAALTSSPVAVKRLLDCRSPAIPSRWISAANNTPLAPAFAYAIDFALLNAKSIAYAKAGASGDVGLSRSRADREGQSGASDRRSRVARDPAVGDEVIHHRGRHERDVECLAVLDPLLE